MCIEPWTTSLLSTLPVLPTKSSVLLRVLAHSLYYQYKLQPEGMRSIEGLLGPRLATSGVFRDFYMGWVRRRPRLTQCPPQEILPLHANYTRVEHARTFSLWRVPHCVRV